MNRKQIAKRVSAELKRDPWYMSLKPTEKIKVRQRVLGQVYTSGVKF